MIDSEKALKIRLLALDVEKYGIMALPVVKADGRVLGVVQLHDLMRAGAV